MRSIRDIALCDVEKQENRLSVGFLNLHVSIRPKSDRSLANLVGCDVIGSADEALSLSSAGSKTLLKSPSHIAGMLGCSAMKLNPSTITAALNGGGT